MTHEQIQTVREEGNAAWFYDETKCPYQEDSEEAVWWYAGLNEALDGYSRSFDL